VTQRDWGVNYLQHRKIPTVRKEPRQLTVSRAWKSVAWLLVPAVCWARSVREASRLTGSEGPLF